MLNRLKTTTALIASLSLIAPVPAYPQQGGANMVCADGSAKPCPEGVDLVPAKKGKKKDKEKAAQQGEGAGNGQAQQGKPKREGGQAAGNGQAQSQPKPEGGQTAGDGQAAGNGQAQQDQPKPKNGKKAGNKQPQEGKAKPENGQAAQKAGKKAKPQAAQSEGAAPAPQALPAEPDAGTTATGEAPAGENAPAETQTEATPKVAPDGTDASGGVAGGQQQDAAKPKAAETGAKQAEPAPEAQPAPETQQAGSKDQKNRKNNKNKTRNAAGEPPVLPEQPDAASGKAPVAAAAAAPADAAPPADAKVTEEVVTKETARSSDEDFANPVNQPAAAQTTQKKKKKQKQNQNQTAAQEDDKGLTDTQKAVLLGLGALAVGAMLSNNRKVELNSGDRVVVERPDGTYQIIKDDNALLRQPGSTVRTERFDDGSTREIVMRPDGSSIVTIRDPEYRVLRRIHVGPNGRQTVLFDDTVSYEPVDVSLLPPPAPEIEVTGADDEAALRAALSREANFDRSFSLAQIRDIEQVRALVPEIDLNAITFETGSAAIRPDQARALSRIGEVMRSYIDENPREVFLIEGHTDAVGSAAANLALSDRRAESVALALTEYYDVPPENMVVQGYGEEFLRVPTDGPERENRRAAVRRITDLLRQAAN